jgi:phospholipid/cholesterol/gamma-HCH transport system permease protein
MILYIRIKLQNFLHDLGDVFLFLCQILKTLLFTRGNLKPITDQIAAITTRSLSTVLFSGIFVGAILVIQFNSILEKYDAQTLLGGLNTSAVVRAIGPLIISFLLAGKIGAYTAAELGTMRVTDQIDAIECLGTNPMQYLVVPRFVGIIFSNFILLAIGLVVSVAGAMVVASSVCGINYLQFASSIPRFTSYSTVAVGMFRSFVYGTIVATVSCHRGFTASGGARGVGQAVTWAAIYTHFYIVIANYFTSDFTDFLAIVFSGPPGSAS